jgi:hypothetical protein
MKLIFEFALAPSGKQSSKRKSFPTQLGTALWARWC